MEEIMICYKCSFKCVKSQLYKTKGYCPRLQFNGQTHKVLISKQVNMDTEDPPIV